MMQINPLPNKTELSAIVVNELKEFGVKCRKEKKSKAIEERSAQKHVFRTHLHLLELADVFVANGNIVQIPKFIADACNRVLEQAETEGIFRKAGSTIRQKEIRVSLEAGLPLGKAHHVIDVANAIKYFFRELPEPLIPCSLQNTLLRCLLIGERDTIKAILLTCLLLPPLTLNTLSFFMQFLRTVSLCAHANKMSSENLAIIFTPALMPFSDINTQRFNSHVKVVQLLIEHANAIGIIPAKIIDKLQINEVLPNIVTAESLEVAQKRKKKRRSDMFNGLRKIVGSALGSSENLENTPENRTVIAVHELATHQQAHSTACLKPTKKRKFTEPVCAFSAKKKRDLLALLPSNSGGLLPNTPLTKHSKKSRLSLGGSRNAAKANGAAEVTVNPTPVAPSMERRWSIVGSGWPKRNKNTTEKKATHQRSFEGIQDVDEWKDISRNMTASQLKCATPNDFGFVSTRGTAAASCSNEQKVATNADSVRISKNEYEAIKERVAAIETRISQEFGSICQTLGNGVDMTVNLNGPEQVLSKYEEMVVKTEALTSPGTEQLAQRLSRGLKIRRSVDQQIIRSPSARKIGTLRRRSQDKKRLSRNPTWHISSTAGASREIPLLMPQFEPMTPVCFYAKSNLKRGRPNTVQSGLQPQHQNMPIAENGWKIEPIKTDHGVDEQWTAGELFFKDLEIGTSRSNESEVKACSSAEKQIDFDGVCTPVRGKPHGSGTGDSTCTPMLPPKSLPRKVVAMRTPSTVTKVASATKMSQTKLRANVLSTPGNEEVNGRASIARLRSQNAGMVMAKAKLFDGLGGGSSSVVGAAGKVVGGCHSAHTDLRKDGLAHCERARIAASTSTPHNTMAAEKHRVPMRKYGGVAVKHSVHAADLPQTPSGAGGRKKANMNSICKSPGSITKRRRLSTPAKMPPRHVINTVLLNEALFETRPSLANRQQFRTQFSEPHNSSKEVIAAQRISRSHKNGKF